ncbi:MAG: ATP-binding protein [Anaerotignaceae bacterium]
MLNDVITISRMRLGSKPIMFITNIDSKLPSKLIGDEIRIKQILINLLSNAIKFTEKGHIALRVFGEMKGDKAELCFQVSDTGFGIKAEDLNLLFAEFERVNTTKNRSIEGTGLGLAISKQLCEMMGGKIYVESTYGKGSIFTMRVVQECPEYERIAMVQKEKTVLLYESRDVYLNSIVETIENLDCKCIPCTNQSQLYDNINLMHYDCVFTSSMHLRKIKKLVKKNVLHTSVAVFADYGQSINDDSAYTMTFPVNCLQMADMLNGQKDDDGFGNSDEQGYSFIAPTARVLVVDDNEVNLKVATGLMLPYQFIIDTAENGIKAVEMVKKHRYDLVFMDHMMPEMDGIDATIEIRQMEVEYYQTLPIIALTANALVGTREMFIREGMNDFLSKPVEVAKMGNILAKWIPKAKKVAILPERKKQEVETLGVEVSGVNIQQGILSVGGSKYDYLQILASYYVDANNKRATLLQHFANKDILAFRTEVHALKSTSATIGATELAGMARDLEMAAIDSDIEFIDSKINKFLNVLQNVIDAIEPLVGSIVDEAQSQKSLEGLKEGTMDILQSELEKLHDAAEFADLGAIEDILDNLNDFSWQDKISEQIANIKKHLAMFDYDGIIECIILLRDF